MRLNFKKVSAIATSALMLSLTMGTALAANYPAPFVSGGSADVAVVYGTGSGVSSLDLVQAGNIQSDLAAELGTDGTIGGGSSVSGDDSFKFEKTSTKFHLGDNITQVISSSLDDDELENLLAEGQYVDDDNDEFDYTQTIAIGANLQLSMFEDNDYAEDEPTVGFKIPNSETVLTYTLDFSDQPTVTDMPTTEIPFMGKSYYILSITSAASVTTMTLLDSAEDTTLTEGETATVAGHSVSISFIDSDEVKLVVDGKTTSSLNEAETQKLADGSYVGIKDILFNSKDTGVSSVEFSIGSGKLTLTGGSEIQINDDTISGISTAITNTTTMDNIVVTWTADDDLFMTPTNEGILMPGFEAVKLSFGGLTYPSEEMIKVEQGGSSYMVLNDFPLKDGEADIAFLYGASSAFTGIGKDASSLLVTSNATNGTQNITFDADTDDYFVVSWSDGNDAESYLVRAENFVTGSDVASHKVDFMYWTGSSFGGTGKTAVQRGDTFSIGNAELAVGNVSNAADAVHIWNNSGNTALNGTLYSKEGLKLQLPRSSTNVSAYSNIGLDTAGAINFTGVGNGGHDSSSFDLVTKEEDKDGTKAAGDTINVTVGWNSDSEVEASNYSTSNADATATEIGDTKVFRDFTYSALATEILNNDPSSGDESITLVYHGEEVEADVYITDPDATITSGAGGSSALGDVLVTDDEVATVSSKNLIVVGGSCINSVAASLLGSGCGSDFTSKTGVGSNQFLIQSLASPYASNQIALVVAGYEAADTVNAATYLKTQTVDTSVGKKYRGTSSTAATLVVD